MDFLSSPYLYPILINALIFVLLIFFGWFFGAMSEKKHIRSLVERERRFSEFLVSDLKTFPHIADRAPHGMLVTGEVVIATDFLKSTFAKIRKFFGGEIRSFGKLVDRARREAFIRLLEEAERFGFNAVCNVRLETADIGGATSREGVAMVAVLASGTAYRIADPSGPSPPPPSDPIDLSPSARVAPTRTESPPVPDPSAPE